MPQRLDGVMMERTAEIDPPAARSAARHWRAARDLIGGGIGEEEPPPGATGRRLPLSLPR